MSTTAIGLRHSPLCRLCGQLPTDPSSSLRLDADPALAVQIAFHLPICPLTPGGLLPTVICMPCRDSLEAFQAFFARLNEGQALLAAKLEAEGLRINMPDWLAEKRTLFPQKYPWQPRKSQRMGRANKGATGTDASKTAVTEASSSGISSTQLDSAGTTVLKRRIKLPKRFEESIQGTALESLFRRDLLPVQETVIEEANQEVKEVPSSAQTLNFLVMEKTKERSFNHSEVLNEETCKMEQKDKRKSGNDNSAKKSCRCDFCQKQFKSLRRFQQHRKSMHANSFFSCPQLGCGKKFRTKGAIELHQSTMLHSGITLVVSPDSLLGSPSAGEALPSVANIAHGQHMSTAMCHDCGKRFKSQQVFQRHVQVVHSDKRPFSCDICGSRFKSKTNLMAHQTSHTGVKRHCCDLCGKQFGYRTSLVQHLRWHDGERPWKCDFCPKAFLNKDAWTFHVRRHEGIKPFSCESCQKSFTEPWALKKHKRLHSGEKPYICELCSKSFSDCSNLMKHKKTHEKTGGTEEGSTILRIIKESITIDHSVMEEREDVQQIIYISYDEEEEATPGNIKIFPKSLISSQGLVELGQVLQIGVSASSESGMQLTDLPLVKDDNLETTASMQVTSIIVLKDKE